MLGVTYLYIGMYVCSIFADKLGVNLHPIIRMKNYNVYVLNFADRSRTPKIISLDFVSTTISRYRYFRTVWTNLSITFTFWMVKWPICFTCIHSKPHPPWTWVLVESDAEDLRSDYLTLSSRDPCGICSGAGCNTGITFYPFVREQWKGLRFYPWRLFGTFSFDFALSHDAKKCTLAVMFNTKSPRKLTAAMNLTQIKNNIA